MKVEERYFEDFAVGETRKSMGRTITEADIVAHAGQTGDFFPHHMDAEWCATQDFKRRMAHGTLVFSVGIGMTASDINPCAMSIGYDRLRFIKPVFIGDTIRATTTIKEKRDHPRHASHGVVVEHARSVEPGRRNRARLRASLSGRAAQRRRLRTLDERDQIAVPDPDLAAEQLAAAWFGVSQLKQSLGVSGPPSQEEIALR